MKTLYCVALLPFLFAGSTVAQAPRSAREAYEIHRAFTAKPDSNGVYEYVERMPEFDLEKWGSVTNYLLGHISLPRTLSAEEDFGGSVVVAFVINEKGLVIAPRIVRGGSRSVDVAVLKVVRNMPRWKPGMHLGKAVSVYFRIPIYIHWE